MTPTVAYQPDLWPDHWVRVMCDWSAEPTWNAHGHPESPFTLPISQGLATQLQAWFEHFDEQDTMRPNPDPRGGFVREGRALAHALRRELPSSWTVVYYDDAKHGGQQVIPDTLDRKPI